MILLLPTLTVVLLGSCVSSFSESVQKTEFNLDAEGNFNVKYGNVNAIIHEVKKRGIDTKTDVTIEKRDIKPSSKFLKNRCRTKKSTSSTLADADADADECNAKPLPLSDIDKQRLLIEVLNTGPATHNGLVDKELFSFENHHGCVALRQASKASCGGDNSVRVVQVDAGGKELVNESVHFENNRPKSVEVETVDRIVVHELGLPSNLTSEGRGVESKPRPFIVDQVKMPVTNASGSTPSESQSGQGDGTQFMKVEGEGQQQQGKNVTSQKSVDAIPGNTQPLKLADWKNQPSSLRQTIRSSCTSLTSPVHSPPKPADGDVHLEVQPQPRQGHHPSEDVDAVDMGPPSAAERTPSKSSLFITTSNLMQYRLAPWGVVEPLRFSASNVPGSKSNLLPSFLAQNLVLFPDVASPKAASSADDPAKRANNAEAMTLIVVQPEAAPVGISGPDPMLLIPERVAADRQYVLVPAEDLLIAAPESTLAQTSAEFSAAHPDKEASTADSKYSYAKANPRPEHLSHLSDQALETESFKKAVHDKQAAQERLESKCHDVDADRDIFNVGVEGSVGTCCGPNCHCTCNLEPEQHPVAASLLRSSASRRHFIPDSIMGRMELSSEQSQERRWPVRKLARMKSGVGQDAQKLEPVLRKSVDVHAYPQTKRIKVGEFALPQRSVQSTCRVGSDPRRAATAEQFDGDLRRAVPLGGRRSGGLQERRVGKWDVYQDMFGSRYKREGGVSGEMQRKQEKAESATEVKETVI